MSSKKELAMNFRDDDGIRIHCCSCRLNTEKRHTSRGKFKTRSRNSIGVTGWVSKRFQSPSEIPHLNDQVESKGKSSIKRIFERDVLFLHVWNVLFMLCIFATSLDILFCYTLVVDEERNCIGFDNKSRTIVVVLRSLVDFIFLILMFFRFHVGHFASYTANSGGAYAIAWRCFLSYFIVDILAVLPLPQVVVLLVIPKLRGSHFMIVVRSLKFVLLVQIFPRGFRIYSFLQKVRWSSGVLPDSAEVKALYNLFLYLFASHVFGVYWYLLSIERKATCWQENCQTHLHCPLNCNQKFGARLEASCSAKASNHEAAFNFGIFRDAFESGVVSSSNLIWKMSYCYWWGLRNLSGLGQNLQTSNSIWEIYFSVTISVSGVVLFAILIGNLQTVMQGRFARLEEIRLERQVIEDWMSNKFLPHGLKRQIMQHQQDKWRETRGVDIENFLNNLPRDLKRDTKRHLCSNVIKKNLWFMNKPLLDAVCDRLKPVLFKKESYIVRKGDPVDEIHFIMRGELNMSSPSDGRNYFNSYFLMAGDICGGELMDWALQVSITYLPTSQTTVRTITEVETFALKADDLRFLASQFHRFDSKDLVRQIRLYSPQWKTWAAYTIQEAWHQYRDRKLKESMLKDASMAAAKGAHRV